MKFNIFFILMLLMLAGCSKDDNTNSKEAYQLSIIYSDKLGYIVVDPLLESYPKGTLVKVKAIPNEGVAFQNWELNSITIVQKEMFFLIDDDTELLANFIENKQESFTLTTSCEINQGTITIYPLKDSYAMGTTVQISAIAKEGYKFSRWEGVSSTDASIDIDMTRNFNIRAIFVNDDGTVTAASDVFLEFDIQWNQDETWTAKAQLTDKKTSKKITGAVIKVNSNVLTEHNFFVGTYAGKIEPLTPGQQVTVSVQYNQEALETFEIEVPPVFTNNPALAGAIKDGVVTITWEKVNCSEYVLYNCIENTEGGKIVITMSEGSPLVATTYTITVDDILHGNNISLTPTPKYFTLWVCPANTLSNLKGFFAKSYIKITGKKSNSVSNKPKP